MRHVCQELLTNADDFHSLDQSVSLDFLNQHRLHDRTISYWLEPDSPNHDPVDQSFLVGPSAHYVSTYAAQYPLSFLSDPSMVPVMNRLSMNLSISSNQWAHGQSPKHDLSILVSLPRLALTNENYQTLFLIPTKVTNADALHTLGQILHGPPRSASDPKTDPMTDASNAIQASENHLARLLYLVYIQHRPSLFTDLTTHANTVALPDKALAALSLLGALISANWSTSTSPPNLTSLPGGIQTRLSTALSSIASTPKTPLDALLRSPARDVLIPYLLAPPQTFSNLVGGRGDTESAAYRIAVARWDVVCLFKRRLDAFAPESGTGEDVGLEGVRAAVAARVAQGVWGQEGAEVGGRIATLEL